MSKRLVVIVTLFGAAILALTSGIIISRLTPMPFLVAIGYSGLSLDGAILVWFLSSTYAEKKLIKNMFVSFTIAPAILCMAAILFYAHVVIAMVFFVLGLILNFVIIGLWIRKMRAEASKSE